MTGSDEAIDGITGEQKVYGSVTGCVNNGTVTNNSTAYGCGGIVGFARYYYGTDSFYAKTGLLSINGNTNNADVIGGTGCGGIVGAFYNYGECNNNQNYAKKIAANGSFAAGIVANAQFPSGAGIGIPNAPADAKLYIIGNVSTTPVSDITGTGCLAQYVWDNSVGKNTIISDNTDN